MQITGPMCHYLDSPSALPPHVNERLSQTSLLLAYDVETNPGPTQLDAILQAIRSSRNKVLEEVRSMKVDIRDIKTDLSNLKVENEQIKLNIKNVHERQSSLSELISSTNKSVDLLQDSSENILLDISHVNDLAEKNSASLELFEADLDRLNSAQISSNMRIFGLDVKVIDQ